MTSPSHPGPKSHAERVQAGIVQRAREELGLSAAQVEQLRAIAAEEVQWLLAEQKREKERQRKARQRLARRSEAG